MYKFGPRYNIDIYDDYGNLIDPTGDDAYKDDEENTYMDSDPADFYDPEEEDSDY